MDEFTMNFFEVFREMVSDSDENDIKKSPFNPAEQTIAECYNYSRQNESTVNKKNVFECNTLPLNSFTEEFIDLLREAELKEMVVTTENGLLDFLQTADKNWCRIVGVCKVSHLTDTVQGIIIQL
ncbi:MAG: hypothetical protein K2H28_03295 [Ruminococcus sp.]|nr:hypothetical protein [Ruminococcus sp.]